MKTALTSITVVTVGLLLGAGAGLATLSANETPPLRGTWSLNNWTAGSDSIQLEMKRKTVTSSWVWSSSQPIADLHGLSLDQLHAPHASVSFTMDRDAGAFTFAGAVTLGIGRGEFGFAPNPTYLAKLGVLGYQDVADADLFGLALRDISLAYAGEVKLSGVKNVAIKDLLRFQDHGVDLAFIRELAAAGYADRLTGDDLVLLRDHGVEGEFVRGLKASGYPDLSAGDIIKLRDHGVDPEYVARVQASGYENLTVDQIVKLHDHGVD